MVLIDPPSSTLGRVMQIDLKPMTGFANFWNKSKDSSPVWQIIADTYINRPYLDIPRIFGGFYDISHDGFTVYHRNHDVTHAVRQKHYAQMYIDIFRKNGNVKTKQAAEFIQSSSEVQSCLELAIFLCRSGRTNEKAGKDDPSNAKRSAALFAKVAQELGYNC